MVEATSLKQGTTEDKREDDDHPLKRIKRELKDWEHNFNRFNGRSPHKEDIRATPSIHALYKEYANLKAQQKKEDNVQHKSKTRTLLDDGNICTRPKVDLGETQDCKQSSDSEASDDSHISATPPRKQSGFTLGLSSFKINAPPLDAIARILSKKSKRNVEHGRLKNDSIFLAEKDNNLQILRKGAKKVSLRSQQNYQKKFAEPETPFSDFVHDAPPSSPNLGFSIKVQRPGGHVEGIANNNSVAEMVSPCFFSSCTPSSLVKPGSRNLLKKLLGSNQDKQCEPRCHGSFSKVHTSHDVSLLNMPQHDAAEVLISVHHQSCGSKEEYSMQVEQGKTKKKVFSDSLISLSAEVSDNVNENGHRGHFISSSETNKTEQENLFSTSATNRMFPTTGKVPDMTIPQEDCAQDGKLGRPVLSKKVPQRLKRGKSREKQQLPEGKSWLHPRVLKKAPRKHQNMIIASKIPVLNNSLDLSKKFTKGGNFVKLNLNGKGSRSRKFVNKGSKRKAMSSVQSFRRGKKLKVDTEHVGTNPLHDVDDADIIDMDEHGNYEEESKTRSLQGRARKLTRETCHLEQTFGDSKCFQIGEKDASDKVILREAAENALREPSDENLLKLLKMTYGYNSFRDGQLETIKRVVAKQSTMLVLPTGSGKSLCYQLPALILPGVTLVISPLVALMVDQLQHLPPMISGSLITSSQTGKDIVETLDRLRAGDIKVLFISPERLLNDNFLSTIECLPLISLVVVDEAHCLSEWSHNFRPSYFRLGSILRKRLRVQCVLAMTATATRKTLHSILCSLEIPLSDVVQVSYLRENIKLSVSLSENRLKDLLLLMKSSPFLEAQSIIIYCKFQSETDSVSKFLRDNSIPAKSYHSALTAKDRNRTQDMFCSNKLRVVVATVAFGMGLDKSDVEAVIHYSLPGSLEHYVQETGRAGRDGRLAHCHMFLDDPTYFKLRSLAYSDGADEYAVNKFLCEVFVANKDKASQICSFNIASASRSFDLKEEVMATILSYLEIGDVQYLRMLPQLNATCSICFHKSSPTLLAKRSILIDVVLKRAQPKHGHYVFDIPTVANETGAMVSQVLKELEKLQFSGEITYDLKDPAFCYIIFKVPENICSLTLLITSWLAEVEASKVRKLDAMYLAATQAVKSGKQYDGCGVSLQQSCLQRLIQDYFESDRESVDGSLLNKARPISPFLRADIKVFLQSNAHMNFTGRAIARIMHGISSPAYPSAIWSKNHFWERYSKIEFTVVKEVASLEILACKGRSRDL